MHRASSKLQRWVSPESFPQRPPTLQRWCSLPLLLQASTPPQCPAFPQAQLYLGPHQLKHHPWFPSFKKLAVGSEDLKPGIGLKRCLPISLWSLILLPLTPFHPHNYTGSLSTENDAISYLWACSKNGTGVVIVGKENSLGVLIPFLVEKVRCFSLDFDHPATIQLPFLSYGWYCVQVFTVILSLPNYF